MSIAVACGQCGKRYAAPEELAGKRLKCPQCGATVDVPVGEVNIESSAPWRDPLADLLDEELTSGPALSQMPDSAGASPLLSAARAKEPSGIPRPPAAKPSGVGRFIRTHRLALAVGVVAVLLLMVYGLSGFYRTAATLLAIGVAIILISFIRRKQEVEVLVAQIIGFSLSGILFLGMVIDLVRVKRFVDSLPQWDGSFFLIILEALAAWAILVVLIAVVCYLSGRFGFFNTLGWMYVCVIGLIPFGARMISSLPEGGRAAPPYRSQLLWRRVFARSAETPPPSPPTHPRPPARPPSDIPVKRPPRPLPPKPVPDTPIKTPGELEPPKPPPRPWNAVPDPAAASSKVLGAQPISLRIPLTNVVRVLFSSAETGRAVVMSTPPAGTPGPRGTATYWIDQFDLVGGRHLGRFEVPGGCEPVDVSPDATRLLIVAKNNAEVWSLEEGTLAMDWRCSPTSTSSHGWAAFVDPNHVVTLQGQRLVAWALPERSEAYSMTNVARAALSPGRNHLVVFETGGGLWPGQIVDASTGKPLGSLAAPSGSLFAADLCAFRRDGRQLAALGSGKLIVWDLESGEVLTEFGPASGRDCLAFVGAEYLLFDGQLFDPSRKAVVWRYSFATSENAWDKVTGSPDGRVWLTASQSSQQAAYLGPARIPDAEAASKLASMPARFQGNSKISIQTIFGGAALPGQPPVGIGVPGPDSSTVAEYEKASRDYGRREYVDLIVGDDAALLERVRWLPAARRPSIGIRWGLGVQLIGEEQQPPISTPEQLAMVTGTIGRDVYLGLERWASEGRFGNWTPGGNVPARQIVLLGGGDHPDLLEAARRQGLDLLVTVSRSTRIVGIGRQVEVLMRVRINDVAGKLPPWSSTLLSSTDVLAGQRMGKDLTAELVADVLKEVDRSYVLGAMPDERAEDVKTRMAEFDPTSLASKDEALPHLVDLRYYGAKQLLTADELIASYDKILGVGKGRIIVGSDQAERRNVLQQWLQFPAN